MTAILARAARTTTLLSLLSLAPACFTDKGDGGEEAGATTGASAGETGAGTAASTDATTGDAAPTTGAPTTSTTGAGPVDSSDGELCAHLGHFVGIKALVADFVERVQVDERINAYFLTTAVDGAALTRCLVEQLGEASGCETVFYTCGDMKTVHAGMGISLADFNDLAEDFSAAMDAHQAIAPELTEADKTAILGVLGSMASDIVEDPADKLTVYQRIGRRPGIAGLVGGVDDPKSLMGLVAGDASINGFFASADLERLATCLVRQVVDATGGPAIYGKEVDAPAPADPGVNLENPCKDMVSSHKALIDANDNLGIEKADFDALVGHLVTAMSNFGVAMTEQNAILGALGPLCPDIVTVDPELCG